MTEWEAIPNGRPRLKELWTDEDGSVYEVVRCWGWPLPPRKIGEAVWRTIEIWEPY